MQIRCRLDDGGDGGGGGSDGGGGGNNNNNNNNNNKYSITYKNQHTFSAARRYCV